MAEEVAPDSGLTEGLDDLFLEVEEDYQEANPDDNQEDIFQEDRTPQDIYAEQQEAIREALEEQGVDEEALEQWRQRYGEFYVFAPSKTDLFVWRPLVKKEWDAMQTHFQNSNAAQDRIQQTVVKRCVLFPEIDKNFVARTKAGLMSSLFEVIMRGSYFFTPDHAMAYVVEL